MDSQITGGLPEDRIITKDLVFPDLLCGLCQRVVWKAFVCNECESPFCEACLSEWKATSATEGKTCPKGCAGEFRPASKVLLNFLKKLKINCQNKANGCDVELTYETLEQHESQCEFRNVSCEACKIGMLQRDLEAHKEVCEGNTTKCAKCGKKVAEGESHDIYECLEYKFDKIKADFGKEIEQLKEKNQSLERQLESALQNKAAGAAQEKEEGALQITVKKLEEENKTLQKNFALLKSAYLRGPPFEISYAPTTLKMPPPHQQKFTMDSSLRLEDKPKIWHIEGYNGWGSIKCYDNIEAVVAKQFNTFQLPALGYGTGWTLFRGCLYYSLSQLKTDQFIGKVNLFTGQLERTEVIADANNSVSTNSWGGFDSTVLLSNAHNVFAVYQSKTTNGTILSLLDPNSLQIIQSWQVTTLDKRSFGHFFLIHDTLYATQSSNTTPTKVCFKFDLKTGKEETCDVSFANLGGQGYSLNYCTPAGQIWTFNNGHFCLYDTVYVNF